MDNFQKFAVQVRNHLLLMMLASNGLVIAGWWVGVEVFGANPLGLLFLSVALATALSLMLAAVSAPYLTRPLRLVSQAIMHVAPDSANIPAPELKNNPLGTELVTNLVTHIYQLANTVSEVEKLAGRRTHHDLRADFVANSLPLPLIVLDKDRTIIFANQASGEYLGKNAGELTGQNIYSVLDMSFSTKPTFDSWLSNAKKTKVIATMRWERVKAAAAEGQTARQFDLASYYNRNNPEGYETILVLVDHTQQYDQDDQALSFVALAVHELRSPVTLLRGYIEAFEEELDGRLSPELTDFMHKMKASAQKLSSFINNILDVSRVETDRLTLKLHEENWSDIIKAAVDDMQLRARVNGVEVVVNIAPGLPTVGVDRVGMYEVVSNLLDNAIKYSGQSKQVVVTSRLSKDGLVETTVQDYGVGIPMNVMPSLFEKFYRSHRSKEQVGGTGLGLYLARAIVEAHGGHIWAQSKEGQGSTFGFTVTPYSQLAEASKAGDSQDIVRGAHGWIKNHSLYRG
ncbi:MAG: ATP-binding protein [Candidatus Saccharimonadales bacterium]